MDLVKIILKNTKDIKKLERQLCCSDSGECPDLSADVGNIIECRDDGLFAEAGESMAIDGDVTSGTPGSVLFIGAGGTLAQDNSNFFYNDTTNNLGIQTSSPTAKLHLGAGSATANTAPIKLTSGTLMTTPETGAIEYDGTHFYGTIGSTRYQLDNTINSANNGLSVTSNVVQLGQAISAPGDPAILTADREIPLSTFSLMYRGATTHIGIEDLYFYHEKLDGSTGFWAEISADVPTLYIFSGTDSPQIVLTDSASNYCNIGIVSGYAYIQGDGIRLLSTSTKGVTTELMYIGPSPILPTAQLHISAGTAIAGTAPLKLTAGINLTTPENGAFEYDGTNLYFTTGGTRKTVTLV